MTRLGWAWLGAHVAAIVFLAWTAAGAISDGRWWAAAGLYGSTALLSFAGGREHERGLAARAAAVRAGRPRPGRAARGDAAAIARAELDRACCERWWTSFGTEHDAWCPHTAWSDCP